MNNWIDDFVRYTDETEPPVSFRQWVGVSVIAAVLQRKVFLQWEGPVYPNFYIVLVAEGGRARKGTAMRYGREFLDELGIELAAENPTVPALIRRMAQAQRTISDGISVDVHSSLTVYSDEIMVFLRMNEEERFASKLCNWFDCPDVWLYETKDKTKTDKVVKLWFNMIGGATPDMIAKYLSPEIVGSGLISRMIFVYEKDKGKIVYVPPTINTELLDMQASKARQLEAMKKDLLDRLHRISVLSGEFRVTSGFLDRWITFKHEAEANPIFTGSPIASYNERRQLHLLKLCMIASAAQREDLVIDEPEFDWAFTLLTATEQKMLGAFQGAGGNILAGVIAKVMNLLAERRSVPLKDIMAVTYHEVDFDTLKKVLQTIRAMGRCTIKYEGDQAIVHYIPHPTERLRPEDSASHPQSPPSGASAEQQPPQAQSDHSGSSDGKAADST